ncbi:T9SS type A sorting domain-containing protein [candidate division KSB1 bacterium]|nr:T9SS type A sorting domain-containing protein [candidate division KSB1 bacterium]RQW01903.1 MAG: T9SS C-terminal target domain-containing protein [candidate division KSB1 bacterium]
MNFITKMFLLLVVLASVAPAQIDLLEIGSFGTIASFSELADERTWSSVDCNGAQVFEIIADPDDAANMVGSFKSTACTDEGFTLEQTFVPFDFSLHNFMSLDVYAPAANRKIVFKIFNSANPDQAKMVEVMTEIAAEWDTLNFDFSGTEAGVYDRISIHPAFGEATEGEEWIFDNIRKDRGGLITYRNDGMLVDFDTILPYTHFWDCNSGGGEYLIVDNPLKDDVNPSEKCALFYVSDCGWEGFAIAEKFEPLDFTITSEAWVKVLAPAADLQFMFKVELWENSGIMVETVVNTTVGNAWEELIFDLSGIESLKYTKIALFPDFQSASQNEDWYIDDIKLVDPYNLSVEDRDKAIKVFALSAKNYPNPYNPTTMIAYKVPLASHVKVTVFDMTGRELATLADQEHAAGEHTVQFDGANLSSGVYFYKVETSYDVVVNKMLLMQ